MAKKVHNSHYLTKFRMRYDLARKGDRVLDLFSADGKLWDSVSAKTPVKVTRVEMEKNRKGVYIQGDNLKVLPNINLSKYDIIDLDAYGTPIAQLEYLFAHKEQLKPRVVIFGTYIQTMYGGLPHAMLQRLGYTPAMIEKAPTLIFRNPLQKLKDYISTYADHENNLELFIQSYGNKHYFYILKTSKLDKTLL